MTVDGRNGGGVGNGNVLWLNANESSVLLVGGVDSEVSTSAAGLVEEPKFRESGGERGGKAAKFLVVGEVWKEVVQHWEQRNEEDCERHGGDDCAVWLLDYEM